MKIFTTCVLAALGVLAFVPISTAARADDTVGISPGHGCGPSRDGKALDLAASKNEGACIYPTGADQQNCTASGEKWDSAHHLCKMKAGTLKLGCNSDAAIFNIANFPVPTGSFASVNVVGLAEAGGVGQTCLGAYGYTPGGPPCGTVSGAGVVRSTVRGIKTIPGWKKYAYQAGPVVVACVQSWTPSITDVPYGK